MKISRYTDCLCLIQQIHDDEERMEGIESQARDDFTIAPVGSNHSFAVAARCASTPFHSEGSSLQSIQDLSRIHPPEKTLESMLAQSETDVKNLR